MNIAILYVCTGKYTLFWKDFYTSCEKNFIPKATKHYFVFTDAAEINFEKENKNIKRLHQDNLGWPDNTLKRYAMFSRVIPELKKYDYVFFFNANLLFTEPITAEEFLPTSTQSLVGALHPGFFGKPKEKWPFESRPESTAYLGAETKRAYYQGAINGGTSAKFIDVIETLKERIDTDLTKNIVAIWHDESQWNRYVNEHQDITKTLSPSYLYPEETDRNFPIKILMRGKDRFFGSLNAIRNTKQRFSRATLRQFAQRLKRITKYQLFALSDRIFCSSFFIEHISQKSPIHSTDPRKISVALTSFHREDMIHKALKNIINDDRVNEIVVLDDGSSQTSFARLKEVLKKFGPKIKLFRREKNLGLLTTKIQVVELCSNPWVILLDSDNTLQPSYINALYALPHWSERIIYAPDAALPLFHFQSLGNAPLGMHEIKDALIRKTKITETFLNTCNYFVPRKSFVKATQPFLTLNRKAADTIFLNYIWISLGNTLQIIKNCRYIHRVHRKSVWKETQNESIPLFEEIKQHILMSESISTTTLGIAAPAQLHQDYHITSIKL